MKGIFSSVSFSNPEEKVHLRNNVREALHYN